MGFNPSCVMFNVRSVLCQSTPCLFTEIFFFFKNPSIRNLSVKSEPTRSGQHQPWLLDYWIVYWIDKNYILLNNVERKKKNFPVILSSVVILCVSVFITVLSSTALDVNAWKKNRSGFSDFHVKPLNNGNCASCIL